MIQILDLLDERRLCLSVSINRKELVLFSGIGLLWQMLGVKRDSKMAKESQKLLGTAIQYLRLESSAAAAEFGTLSNSLVSLDGGRRPSTGKHQHPQEMVAPTQKPSKSPKKHLQALKSHLVSSSREQQLPQQTASPQSRRNTISGATPPLAAQSLRSPSWTSLPSEPDRLSAPHFLADNTHSPLDLSSDPRLVAMSYEHHRSMSCSTPSDPATSAITMADWEYVLSDMDRGYSNIFTGIYGGKECGEDPGPFASITAEYNRKTNDAPLNIPQPELHDLSPEAWSASSADFAHTQKQTTQSVLSYSSESMGSGDDPLAPYTDVHGLSDEVNTLDPFNAFNMPDDKVEEFDEFSLVNGWDRRLAV
jgi:hypothetical protein